MQDVVIKGDLIVVNNLNEGQKEIFESWVLTAKFYGYPNEWIKLYNEAGYTGYYYWTIIE